MVNTAFSHWFDSVRVNLDQVGHFDHLSKQEQIWFHNLYRRNWIPAYYAARLFVEGPITYTA